MSNSSSLSVERPFEIPVIAAGLKEACGKGEQVSERVAGMMDEVAKTRNPLPLAKRAIQDSGVRRGDTTDGPSYGELLTQLSLGETTAREAGQNLHKTRCKWKKAISGLHPITRNVMDWAWQVACCPYELGSLNYGVASITFSQDVLVDSPAEFPKEAIPLAKAYAHIYRQVYETNAYEPGGLLEVYSLKSAPGGVDLHKRVCKIPMRTYRTNSYINGQFTAIWGNRKEEGFLHNATCLSRSIEEACLEMSDFDNSPGVPTWPLKTEVKLWGDHRDNSLMEPSNGLKAQAFDSLDPLVRSPGMLHDANFVSCYEVGNGVDQQAWIRFLREQPEFLADLRPANSWEGYAEQISEDEASQFLRAVWKAYVTYHNNALFVDTTVVPEWQLARVGHRTLVTACGNALHRRYDTIDGEYGEPSQWEYDDSFVCCRPFTCLPTSDQQSLIPPV